MAPQSSTSQLAHPSSSLDEDDTDDMMSEGGLGVGGEPSSLSPSVAAVGVALSVGAIPKQELEQEEVVRKNCDHLNDVRPELALESSKVAIVEETEDSASSNNDNTTGDRDVHDETSCAGPIASDDSRLSQDTAPSSSPPQQEAASSSTPDAETEVSESSSSSANGDADSTGSIPNEQQTEPEKETKAGTEITTRQQREGESGEEQGEGTNEETEKKPLLVDFARRGAVGAVGGAMTAVGLVMIPLPTPFGAVIASSGLAVLGTEFKGAKDLNDKLIEGAKQHVNTAREYMVKSIESMEDTSDHDHDHDHTDTGTKTVNSSDSQKGQDDPTASALKVLPVKRGESTISDAATESTIQQEDIDEEDDVKDEVDGCDTTVSEVKRNDVDDSNTSKNITNVDDAVIEPQQEPPKWLHMNQIERERQERLARLKYERESKSNLQQTKESLIKKTGLSTFLSRNVLPILKGSSSSSVAENSNCNNKMIDAAVTSSPAIAEDDDQHNSRNTSLSSADTEDDSGFVMVNASGTTDS